MAQIIVEGAPRATRGKNEARRLRVSGKVPATLYGGKGEVLALAVNTKQVTAILRSETGHNTLFQVDLGGRQEPAIVKDWQVDPVSGNLLQLDGWHGLAGWQWVFLIEGIAAMLAIACPILLRDRVADAHFLTAAERTWLEERLEHEDRQSPTRTLTLMRALATPTIVMLILGLTVLPRLLDDAAPLRYRVQTFLQYGTSATFWVIAPT